MPINYQALRDELINNPKGYPYPVDSPAATADALNQVRAEEVVTRTLVPAREVFACFDPAELLGLTEPKRSYVTMSLVCGDIDVSNSVVRAAFGAIFTSASQPISRGRLIALQTRPGSRAEVLFGENTRIRHEDVTTARSMA